MSGVTWRYKALAASIAIASAIGYSAFLIARGHVVQASESRSAFSADIVVSMYSGSGRLDFKHATRYYRFGDGSVVYTLSDLYPEPSPTLTKIMNATTGAWIFLDPVSSSAISLRKTVLEARNRISEMEREQSCPSNVSKLPDGSEMSGLATVHEVQQLNQDVTEEKWMAPALDCFPLKEIDTSKSLDGAYNIEIVTSLRRGEPDKSLLQIPFGYTKRAPLAVEKVHRDKVGTGFLGPAIARKLQREYEAEPGL